jgi:hypothetical protein
MLNTILAHLDVFPPYLRSMLIGAAGLWLFVFICSRILALLQAQTMQTALRSAPAALERIGARLEWLLEDPHKYPRITRVLDYGTVLAFYSLSTILFLDFVVLVLLLCTTPKHLTLAQNIGVASFSIVCVFAAALLKAQAGRCRQNL